MFPIRDDNPQLLTPYVTYGIIGLNALAWVLVQGVRHRTNGTDLTSDSEKRRARS